MKPLNRIQSLHVFFIAIFFLSGCTSLGKENVLFITKTSVGVDVDSKPPTLDIGFDRKEGTISPVFEKGQVLSQMASFDSKLGVINQAIGQSFATGQAAETLSKHMFSVARQSTGTIIHPDELDITKPTEITTSNKVKRYFFGTDTSFGFRVNFGLETGGVPDSLSLGYKRKEIAFVPLIPNGTNKVSLASLLATSGLNANAKKFKDAGTTHSQYFATGKAANNLSAIPEVRKTVIPTLTSTSIEEVASLGKEIKIQREKDFTNRQKQQRVSSLLDSINKLDDAKAFELSSNPPVDKSLTEPIIKLRDPNCMRLAVRDCITKGTPDPIPGVAAAALPNKGDPKIAKEMLKTRAVMGQRDDASLNAWEAAVKANE